jgi:hypothetical protein
MTKGAVSFSSEMIRSLHFHVGAAQVQSLLVHFGDVRHRWRRWISWWDFLTGHLDVKMLWIFGGINTELTHDGSAQHLHSDLAVI